MSKYGKRAKEYLERKEQERLKSSLSKENLLTRSGLAHEYMGGKQDGYTSLYKTWENLYKKALDYYNNEEGYTNFYNAYNGMSGKQGYVGKRDAGRWYSELEGLKNTANEGVDALLAELDKYSRYYNEDAVNYVRDLVTQRQKSYDDVMTEAGKFRDHWSQWETEDDYNTAVWESDFYTKLQDGNFADASAMYKDLAGSSPDNAKLSEYGEYLKAAKNNDLINKYKGMSADELLAEKERLEKSMPSNLFNADPLTNEAAKNSELMLELQFVSQLYDDTALKEKYASYDVDAGQADIDFLRGYAERAKEIKSQIAAIDGKINQRKVDGKNVDALLGEKMRLQMSLYQLSEEYRDATMSSVERNHAKVTGQSNNKYGIDTSAPDYMDVVDFDELLSQAEADHTNSKRNKQNVLLSTEPLTDPEFNEKSVYIPSERANSTWWDQNSKFFTGYGHLDSLGYGDTLHEYINGDDNVKSGIETAFKQDEQSASANSNSNVPTLSGTLVSQFYDQYGKYAHMTEDQKAIYNYYYNTQGKEAAARYLNSIEEDLNASEAEDIYERLKDKPTLVKQLYSIPVGFDQFKTGLAGIFSDGYTPASPTQVTGQLVREDLADEGMRWYNVNTGEWNDVNLFGNSTAQILYDIGSTTSNMLPSILTSAAIGTVSKTAGAAAGAALLGASAGGNAKTEMLNLGYSKDQANAYGLLVGASEAGLSYLMSGIPGLRGGDGVVSGALTKILGKVDNALAKAAIAFGGVIDEGVEEGLQTVLEDWFKEIATGVDFEDPSSDEILYSSLLGMLNSAGMNAGGAAINGIGSAISKQNTFKTEGAKYTSDPAVLIDEALAIDPENKYALKLKEKLESGEKISQAQLGKLSFGNMETVSKTLTESDKAAKEQATNELVTKTEKRLLGKIENTETRVALAESLANAIEGEHVSNAEIRKIAKNQAALNVLNDNLGTRFKTGNVKVSDVRQAISQKQSNSTRLSSENILSTYSAFYDMDEAAERSLMVNYAADVKNAENGKAINPEDYAAVYGLVYAAGKNGADVSKISADAAKVLSPNAMAQAYKAGQNAAKDADGGSSPAGAPAVRSGEVQEFKGSVTGRTYSAEAAQLLSTAQIGEIDSNKSYYTLDDLGIPKAEQQAWIDAGIAKERTVRGQSVVTVNTTVLKDEVKRREFSQTDLQNGANSGTINTYGKEAQNEQGIHLRDSGERYRGQNTQGQIPGMEGYAGQDQSRREGRTRPRDSEAASLSYDREVSTKSLGIKGGLEAGKVRLVAEGSETASMKKAKRIAAERGLNVKFFGGGNLKIASGQKIISARAYIQGNDVYIRADHSEFTSDQLMRHESGHDMIAKGEVNVADVRKLINERFTPEEIDAISAAYAIAYADTGLTTDEIWEEVICDSLADMNVFEGRNEASAEMAADFLPDLKEATLESKKEARGPPKAQEGKASMELESLENIAEWEKPITLQDVLTLRSIGRKSINKFTAEDIKKAQKWAYKFYKELGVKSPFFRAWFGEWREHQTNKSIRITGGKTETYAAGKSHNVDMDMDISWGRELKGETINHLVREKKSEVALENVREIIENAVYFDTVVSMPTSKTKMPNTAFMHSLYTLYRSKDGGVHLLKVYVEEALSNNEKVIFKRGYELKDIIKVADLPNSVLSQNGGLTDGTSTTTYSIADLYDLVKTYDKDFSPAPEVSKYVLNEDGTPKVFYHGTKSQFDMFSYGKIGEATGVGILGEGFYFTDKKKLAKDYGSEVKACYLQMSNPYIASADEVYRLNTRKLSQQGYDGVILSAPNGTIYSVFDNTQIKSATDNIGTFDKDNADIRFSQEIFEDLDEEVEVAQELSDRERLAAMFESEDMSPSQKGMLTKYKNKLSEIEANEAKIAEMTEELDALKKKGKGNSSRAATLETKIRNLEKQNAVSEGIILNIEAAKPIKRLLERERRAAYQEGLLAGQMAQGKDTAPKLRKTEEELAATKQKSKELRQKRKDDLDALAKRYQESRAKSVEGRSQTAMRHKIQGVVAELDHLLRHGNKKSNVKIGLQDAVAAALEAFDVNSERMQRYAKTIADLDARIAAATDPVEIEALTTLREKKQQNSDRLSDKLQVMKKAYEDIHNNADGESYPSYYRAEAKVIMDRIGDVMSKVGDTPISEMTSSQLQSVYDMYRMVLTTVRDANKAFINGKLEDLTENAAEMESDLRKIKKLPEERLRAGDDARGFGWNELTPYYAFKRIGSETLMRYYDELVRGQDVYARDLDEAKQFAEDVRKKYKANKWNRNELTTFKDKDGRTFRLNLEQMMSIYAYSKREQALDHMEKGGFFFNNKETFRTKGGVLEFIASNESGYKVNSVVLAKIAAALTPDQRAYVDEMQAYLTEMGEKGNEVSRQMWGINIFNEKVYFPLKSKDDFIYQANTPAETSSLKNDGMTKETKPHASNPIVLESFDEVWANHVEKMSKYHGFVIPIDNLNKLINYGSWIDGEAQSISTMLEARYSSAVNDYLTTFIKDLNGAKAQNGGLLGVMSNWLTKFKKTAVAASLSVVVQQPTAILRATSEIDAKYFAHLPKAETLNKKWDKIKKYAPIAIIKDIGGFDAGSGKQIAEWLNADTRQGLNKAMNKVDDVTMMGAALGDQIGWGSIWTAVEREVQAKQHLQYGTKEFYEAVGKRFTDVIVKTQVYDSTLSRSGFMRGKDGLLKMATAFMGEPTLSINMLADTFLQAKRGTIKKRQAARTIAAVYSATIAASIVKSLVYALRDDDDDEAYLEKYAQALGGTILSDINPLSMLPIFRDVLSIMEGWDVERTDMAIVQDLYNAVTALGSENKTTWRKIEDLAGALAALVGVPAKNLLRTAREMYNAFNDIFDGIEGGNVGGAFIEGVTGDEKSKYQTLYEALIGGDPERIAALRKGYKTDEDYMTAIRIALRKYDPRIKKAAQALYEGDLLTRNEIMLEILKEGVFDKATVDRAIDAEAQAIKAKENESSTTEKEDDGEGSIYSSNDINVAFNYGSYDLAIEIIAELTEIKVEQKVKAEKDKAESKGKFFDEDEAREEAEYEVATSLRSVMTKYWKPKYQQAYASGNSAEMGRIEDILYTSGLYEYKSGKTIDDVLEDWTASYDEE